jgi:hypothetical protein
MFECGVRERREGSGLTVQGFRLTGVPKGSRLTGYRPLPPRAQSPRPRRCSPCSPPSRSRTSRARSFVHPEPLFVSPRAFDAPQPAADRGTSPMRNTPPSDPTVGLCLRPYGCSREGGFFYDRSTPVRKALCSGSVSCTFRVHPGNHCLQMIFGNKHCSWNPSLSLV